MSQILQEHDFRGKQGQGNQCRTPVVKWEETGRNGKKWEETGRNGKKQEEMKKKNSKKREETGRKKQEETG